MNRKMFTTEQEAFWAGEFGDEYAQRNRGADWIARNVALFSQILRRTRDVRSVIELGANIGLNLRALATLLPDAKLSAVEINEHAAGELGKIEGIEVFHVSILDFTPQATWDFVLVKGVLIHLHPDALPRVYETLYRSTGRFLCIAEYFNPSPVAIAYRGFSDRLFKRDFAGEIMGQYPDLRLNDYGFVYRGDPMFPQDDVTWFLLEKASR